MEIRGFRDEDKLTSLNPFYVFLVILMEIVMGCLCFFKQQTSRLFTVTMIETYI